MLISVCRIDFVMGSNVFARYLVKVYTVPMMLKNPVIGLILRARQVMGSYAMQVIVDELQHRWQLMFAALARGDDLPPGLRLRAEGMMEAAVLVSDLTETDLIRAMDACFEEAFGQSLDAALGEGWRGFYPFPQIPAVAARAPVYPSTKD
jgi:hypothetical protein